jgi:hypothetical protein
MRSSNSIVTDRVPQPIPIFLEALTAAISRLKNRLQQNYQQAYPDLGDIGRRAYGATWTASGGWRPGKRASAVRFC